MPPEYPAGKKADNGASIRSLPVNVRQAWRGLQGVVDMPA
jgi:hypothetical protein